MPVRLDFAAARTDKAVPPASSTIRPTDPQKRVWIRDYVNNLHLRWNGPDGAMNPGPARIKPRNGNAFRVTCLRFIQTRPNDATAAIHVILKPPQLRPGLDEYNAGNQPGQLGHQCTPPGAIASRGIVHGRRG